MKSAMKLLVGTVAAAGLLLAASSAMAATIVGSKHDFASGSTNAFKGTSDQTCIYCHAPHNTDASVKPLWNRALNTTSSYTLYSSPTLHSTVGQPQGVSKMCLSCHDGTLAVDGYGIGTSAVAGTKKITAASEALLGVDLSNDHPVSFQYTSTSPGTANGYKAPPSTLPLYGTGKDQLECATCHDVHDPAVGGFLRLSNANSALCVACHSK